jgi:hypothetical protein
VREFELEVKNTGEKPIYLIYIELISDVKLGNTPLVFLWYTEEPNWETSSPKQGQRTHRLNRAKLMCSRFTPVKCRLGSRVFVKKVIRMF